MRIKHIRKIKSQKDYIQLVEELIEHDKHYYEECTPAISDYEYDLLIKEIQQYEKKHPDIVLPNSPTKRVGETITKGFKHGSHVTPMLSLANTYSEKELSDFLKRIYKLLEKKAVEFCVELKMDGTAVSIRYEKGKLVRALTRGNGRIGDDVTSNIKTIHSLPLKLKGLDYPDILEVRGEVFMHKKTFQEMNKKREEEGLDAWANPRNAAAGSLKLLDPKEVMKRRLDIVLYGVAESTFLSTQYEIHKTLKKWGLPISKEEYFTRCNSLEQILKFAEKINEKRKKLSFEIDGIVIKVDALASHKKLGTTGKSPRFAVAYKFAPEQAYSKICDIIVQVGRTGVLTPVAELEPINLAGSTISRATLHNRDEVQRKDIRVGDWVVIEKGGDVIPKVVKVDFSKRSKKSFPWHMPQKCPVCHTKTVHKQGEVAVRCPNTKCYGRQLRHIFFFASKAAMDIEHLGPKVVQQLVDKGIISCVSDLYRLDVIDLAQLEGFKDKSIQNLLDSIEASKKCSLSRFIMGLEIQYVGAETAHLLAETAGNLETLMHMKEEDLLEIEGVGEKVAKAVVKYFQDKQNKKEIHLLLKYGVQPGKVKRKKVVGHAFSGKIFVLTGVLEDYTRQEASSLIKERGGKTSSSVSKKTDFILVGEEPGSKYNKAKVLGVKILTEKEFKKML